MTRVLAGMGGKQTARMLLAVFCGCALVLLLSQWAGAVDWPEYPAGGKANAITRGPGGYLSWWKLLLYILLFLLWVKTTDWVSRDVPGSKFNYAIWNAAVTFPFLVSLIFVGFTVPIFAAAFPVTLLAYLVPLVIYILKRNNVAQPHERVMTPAHLRYLLAVALKKVGVKISAEKKAEHEKGAVVGFVPMGPDAGTNQANLILARQHPSFVDTKGFLADAADHRAERVMVDFLPEEAKVKYHVDGVWHDGDTMDREKADGVLVVLKTIATLDPKERRQKQEGTFGSEYQKEHYTCHFSSQGTKTGERMLLHLQSLDVHFHSLDELGMRSQMIERLKELMLTKNGIFIFAALPAGGLSTTLSVALSNTDRLLRDFSSVEEVNDRIREVENVDPVIYDASEGESPDQVLPDLMRKQPDVLVVPHLTNKETITLLCKGAVEDHLIFTTMRTKEAVEALLRVLLLKVPAKSFAPVAIGVLNQRLMRKLCEKCKEPYEPPASLLKKLGISSGRVTELYRHPEEPEEVCPDCSGLGYLGRTSIFELLVVDDAMREALIKQPKLEILRQVARKAGGRTLQEEGILAVVRGVTSLAELMRVLKQ